MTPLSSEVSESKSMSSSLQKMEFQPVKSSSTIDDPPKRPGLDRSVGQSNVCLRSCKKKKAPPSSSSVPAILFIIGLILAYVIPAAYLARNEGLKIFWSDEDLDSPENTSGVRKIDIQFNFYVTLAVIPPIIFFIQWALASIGQALFYVFDRTSYIEDDDDEEDHCPFKDQPKWYHLMKPTRSSRMFHACIVCSMLKHSVPAIMTPVAQGLTIAYMEFGNAIFLFLGWTFALEDGHQALYDYAETVDGFVAKNKKSQKWLNIMKEVGSFQKPEVDKFYRNAGFARSPAYALAGAVGMFVVIGKFSGLALLLSYMIGLDLYKNIFIVGLTALVALATNAASLNGTIGTLSSLTMSNSVHAGELIALSGSSSPGHNPGLNIVGFCEGFTWSHIVIRDFKKNQVFVPYDELASLTLTNWSRRPSKLVSIELAVQPSLSGGANRLATLCSFVKEWMQRHPDLDQDGYTKAIIKHSDGMPTLLVMFYNRIGRNKNQLRNEFIVMLMDAAQKLDLCLTPAERRPTKNWDEGEEKISLMEESDVQRDLFDLMPSEELTARSGSSGNKKNK